MPAMVNTLEPKAMVLLGVQLDLLGIMKERLTSQLKTTAITMMSIAMVMIYLFMRIDVKAFCAHFILSYIRCYGRSSIR